MKIYLKKHEVFAIRGEEWLFSICPISFELDYDSQVEAKVSELYLSDKPKGWWANFWYSPKSTHDWKQYVIRNRLVDYQPMQQERDKIWKNIRQKYNLISVNMAGSFSDHMVTIEDNETKINYRGFCNNYGGDNPFITFEQI